LKPMQKTLLNIAGAITCGAAGHRRGTGRRAYNGRAGGVTRRADARPLVP
jgi:hypothetical protein